MGDPHDLPEELIEHLSAINAFSGQIEDYLERWRDILDPIFYAKLEQFGKLIRKTESEIFGLGGWVNYTLDNFALRSEAEDSDNDE